MSEAAVVFKKRARGASQKKKRPADEAAEDDESVPVFKKAKVAKRGLTLADSTAGKKSEDGEGVHFESAGAALTSAKSLATVEITDSNTRRQQVTEGGVEVDAETGKKIYKGKMQEIGLVHSKRAGPMKNVENLRVTVRFDYAPDICKDYKETGYCGYGDSCKFMHDRGDYKSGWQIEREWEAEQKKKREAAASGSKVATDGDNEYFIDSDDEDGDGLPFACAICREHFTNPVVTKCKHYFCEKCAIDEFKKDHRCFICKEPTGGQFNVAHEILKKAHGGEK